jgi:hypothetical protein
MSEREKERDRGEEIESESENGRLGAMLSKQAINRVMNEWETRDDERDKTC